MLGHATSAEVSCSTPALGRLLGMHLHANAVCVCVCAAHCNLGHRAASPACEASRDEDFALNSQRNLDEQHGATCMRHDTGMLSSHHSRLTFEAQPKPSGCHSLPWFVTLDLGVGSFDAVV